jgi:CheY-like chemotaxis protein
MENPMATCLIVEDDEGVRNLQVLHLKKLGYAVFEAADGVQGYDVFSRVHPDLVVCDAVMPNMTGWELISKIRLEDSVTPIVCVSGGGRNGSSGHLDQALECGANAVLQKPFTKKEFIEVVTQALGPTNQDASEDEKRLTSAPQ